MVNASLLRESFEWVTDANPSFAAVFYDNLFRKFPQTRPLFSPDRRERQEQMLTEAVVAVLTHMEDAAWLAGTLGPLGAKHASYGVTPEMYGWVGDTLLGTLAEVAGSRWTLELYVAWADAYNAITELMLQGAAQAH